ncbi:MmgE/PrpD family protein [Candidatus Poriferisodalis sp.]|uniref:MmgE/PrpD family protein n=1 Tax=Candidatus Poriferisodalis sp. TaxID=3101277 RepID=UPI003B019969
MGLMAADGATNPTAALAEFLAEVGGSVPERLTDIAQNCVADTLGCMIYGAVLPWTRTAAAYARQTGGSGSSPIVGGGRTTAPMAAFANGAAAHAFELDDVHEESISHPGAVVIPAVLALAEELGAGGSDALDAIVVGYEAMGRAGIAVGPAAHMLAGFHPTSMCGVFGSAAAAARLLGLDAGRLRHALGIAATLASGTMEFASSGGQTKRLHAGRAAEGGVMAARLAAAGFEGPEDGLTGAYGFCRVFGDEPSVELLTDGLGRRWMLDEITVKPWAACSDIHPLIQATLELRDAHRLRPDMIQRIEATASTKAAVHNSGDGMASVMAAQYSGPWNIAAALVADPADPATYSADRIADAALVELQSRVVGIAADARWDATYAHKMGGSVRITLRDGSVLERSVCGQKGSMHDPLSADDIEAKLAMLVGSHEAALWDWVRALPSVPRLALPSVVCEIPP